MFMQHLIIGISSAVFFFILFSIFFGKSDKEAVDEINKAHAELGKPPINEKKGKMLTRIGMCCAAGVGAGLVSWIIAMVF